MVTVTIKENSKQAKAFIELLRTLPYVEFHEEKEKSPYNPEFVKKIKEADQRGEYKEVDANNLWESIGLK